MKRSVGGVALVILALALATGVAARGRPSDPGSGNTLNAASTPSGTAQAASTADANHSATVAPVAASTCTATNTHANLPSTAGSAAQTAVARPNHGQSVSAVARSATPGSDNGSDVDGTETPDTGGGSSTGTPEADDRNNGAAPGATVAAVARSKCTAPNTHSKSSHAKPNHGQCVSAVARSMGRGRGEHMKRHGKGHH